MRGSFLGGVILSCLMFLAANPGEAAAEKPKWSPRLLVTASGSVWSPGGIDKDRFEASFGGSASVIYWAAWNTQVMLGASYSPLKTHRYAWTPAGMENFAPDVWDVKGSLWVASIELRRLFPTDNRNFLYVAAGGSYFHFGDVEGDWQIYTQSAVQSGVIHEKRNPSDALGVHFAPGLFFLYHPKVSVDVAIRVHLLYDGEDVNYWLQPTFSLGYRLF